MKSVAYISKAQDGYIVEITAIYDNNLVYDDNHPFTTSIEFKTLIDALIFCYEFDGNITITLDAYASSIGYFAAIALKEKGLI